MNTYPPTPVTKLNTPEHENRVFIKRDDLMPFSFGGNKVRIAQAFFSDMQKRQCTAMIFYGDRRSNLCRVLANLCFANRIPAVMIETLEDKKTDLIPFNRRLIDSFNIPVITCEKDKIAEAVDTAVGSLSERGFIPYYIYGNRLGTGNEGIAARAYACAYREIREYEERTGVHFDRIFTPYGTGATQGGLICGSLLEKDDRNIIGISISSRSDERAKRILALTVADFFTKNGNKVPEGYSKRIHLETKYNLGGYGIYNEEVRNVIRTRMEEDGIPFDPTYTGKAYLGMSDYLAEHDIRNENILFIHTGGMPLYFDYLNGG